MWDALHFWLLDSQCKPTPNHVLLGSHFAFPCSKPALRPWDLRGAHFSIRDSPFRRHIGRGNLPYGTLLVLRIRLQMESGFGHYSKTNNILGFNQATLVLRSSMRHGRLVHAARRGGEEQRLERGGQRGGARGERGGGGRRLLARVRGRRRA